MNDDLDQMGPIDYIVVEFPGSKMTGEGFPLLLDLVDRGIIRILDLAFVTKDARRVGQGLAIADFDGDGELDLAVFEGASSGLIGQDDLDEAGGVLEPGSSAGILVYENVWAGPFAAALRRGGGQLVASGRIPVQAMLAAVEAADAADARPTTREKRHSHARTSSRGRPDRRDRRYGHRGLQPGLTTPGRPMGGPGAAAGAQQQYYDAAAAAAAAPAAPGRRHGRQARSAQGARRS